MKDDCENKYWRALEELDLEGATGRTGAAGAERRKEDAPDPGVGRREFLQLAGFTLGASALFGCTRGLEHGAIPYLIRPEEVTPGRAYWYASVCGGCAAGCGILSKGRDGRPIKLEGNPGHPLSHGGLCAVGQASVLALYDSNRFRQPLEKGVPARWSQVDQKIQGTLDSIRQAGGNVRFLTDSGTGPAERDGIAAFLSRFEDGRHVTYDPISSSAIAEAHLETHGVRRIPRYRFERAKVLLGVGSDFLGTWFSPVEHTAGYRKGRDLEGGAEAFSHHIQIESRLTLTGGNADRRFPVPPGSLPLILAHLATKLSELAGSQPPWTSLPSGPLDAEQVGEVARKLWGAPRGRSLVVCGESDVPAQKMTNYINYLLGNYGSAADNVTITLEESSSRSWGSDSDLKFLLDELEEGKVKALFIRGGNPLYDLPGAERLSRALKRVDLVVSFAGHPDETSRSAHFVCPEPHFLESWGDAEPVSGLVAIRQPAIRPLGATRPLLESLAVWSGEPATARDLLQSYWRRVVHPRRKTQGSFEYFWNQTLHDGFALVDPAPDYVHSDNFNRAALTVPSSWRAPSGKELLLELHPSACVLDGRHALNPWLQELPDPIAKTVWDNFAALSPVLAAKLDVNSGDMVKVSVTDTSNPGVELPALIQPGQQEQTLSIALGYGREGTERFTKVGPQWWEGRPTVEPGGHVGSNAAPLLAWKDGVLVYSGRSVRLEKTGSRRRVASTQSHHSLVIPDRLAREVGEERPIVQEATLAEWKKDPSAGGHGQPHLATLWTDHEMSPHHWGLAIDLTACTGCSACVIACQAENNIPVVGKDEVRRSREMHWLRIDRYYRGAGSDVEVVHMPMMCQHCDNAPCETVCPVQATAQSAEGLNQQIYNRCVGTRYCANNCPYKVRRFNWFDYPREDRLQNLALNPEVAVRSRGVMEKCSMCVQRIQDAKAEAKRKGRELQDGDIQPACVQSCPAGAIVFGDMNNPESRLMKLKEDPRHYTVLAETGVRPVVGYLTRIRNRGEG